MQTVYLTRRNLLTLLSKLDRAAKGEFTNKTLIKGDTVHPLYPCSDVIAVIAIEDDDYYIDRVPGGIHPDDDLTFNNRCNLCGHSLTDNEHGFDQNDAWMDGEKLVHSGLCTYCKACQSMPAQEIKERLAKREAPSDEPDSHSTKHN